MLTSRLEFLPRGEIEAEFARLKIIVGKTAGPREAEAFSWLEAKVAAHEATEMQVVPVIDLIDGVVVRGELGDRDAYRPIETPLSATPDPVDVAAGFLRLAPFPTLYVADLDAIRGRGDNFAALARLRAAFPELALWIDNGAADVAAVAATGDFGAPVLGSESQRDNRLVEATPDAVLSLDFRGDAFQGPPELLARPEIWPERIIVMTLAASAAARGPISTARRYPGACGSAPPLCRRRRARRRRSRRARSGGRVGRARRERAARRADSGGGIWLEPFI